MILLSSPSISIIILFIHKTLGNAGKSAVTQRESEEDREKEHQETLRRICGGRCTVSHLGFNVGFYWYIRMSKSVKFCTFNVCCTSIKLFKKKKKKRERERSQWLPQSLLCTLTINLNPLSNNAIPLHGQYRHLKARTSLFQEVLVPYFIVVFIYP